MISQRELDLLDTLHDGILTAIHRTEDSVSLEVTTHDGKVVAHLCGDHPLIVASFGVVLPSIIGHFLTEGDLAIDQMVENLVGNYLKRPIHYLALITTYGDNLAICGAGEVHLRFERRSDE
jgi:hypothetical protein